GRASGDRTKSRSTSYSSRQTAHCPRCCARRAWTGSPARVSMRRAPGRRRPPGAVQSPSDDSAGAVGPSAGDSMSYRLGVDVGGTFTDLVLVGPDGRALTRKVLSSTGDYAEAIVRGASELMTAAGIG